MKLSYQYIFHDFYFFFFYQILADMAVVELLQTEIL